MHISCQNMHCCLINLSNKMKYKVWHKRTLKVFHVAAQWAKLRGQKVLDGNSIFFFFFFKPWGG